METRLKTPHESYLALQNTRVSRGLRAAPIINRLLHHTALDGIPSKKSSAEKSSPLMVTNQEMLRPPLIVDQEVGSPHLLKADNDVIS